jgi:N-methylhydantoinase A/oxoprolinase/acetone carboxylase beta subunit
MTALRWRASTVGYFGSSADWPALVRVDGPCSCGRPLFEFPACSAPTSKLANSRSVEAFLNVRFAGTDCSLMTPALRVRSVPACRLDELTCTDAAALFLENYRREFGFVLAHAALVVDDLRVRAVGRSGVCRPAVVSEAQGPPVVSDACVRFQSFFKMS